MSDWGWKRYVPVTVRRKQAGKVAARAARAGAALSPVPPSRGAIAKTFWTAGFLRTPSTMVLVTLLVRSSAAAGGSIITSIL